MSMELDTMKTTIVDRAAYVHFLYFTQKSFSFPQGKYSLANMEAVAIRKQMDQVAIVR